MCDPPITVANLETYSKTRFLLGPDICATIFDKDGITMGLAYDTATAMVRLGAGEDAWMFHVMFGIHQTLENSQSATTQ
jgi:hypothetical protein